MSFQATTVPNLADGETAYTLTDDPANGAIVAVLMATQVVTDAAGGFVALRCTATGRWIDAQGVQQTFPGTTTPVTAIFVSSNADGTATAASVLTTFLDGRPTATPPMPSPMRRAICAAQAIAAA